MSQHGPGAGQQFDGTVAAAFPLALLESIRSHDRPGEILEDEDLTVSLPRRLGLTGVVDTQIRRYSNGRNVPLGEALSLFRLVMRRTDAEPILREAGQRVARWRFRRTPGLWRALLHRAPSRLGIRSARRAAVAALRSLHAGSSIEATKPFTIVVADCVTARLEDSGSACTLFTGLMEELLLLHTGKPHAVTHTQCMYYGYDRCEWSMN